VVLSTITTVIASQALISGAFSLAMQGVQLGYLPRLRILHTSSEQFGQIYIPFVNWVLLVATILLVLGFRSSSALAATYGTAVSLTMLITTFLMFFAARHVFGWKLPFALGVCLLFGSIDLQFFAANSVKFTEGGWFPLLLAGGIFTVMSTWWRGRQILAERLIETTVPLVDFIQEIEESGTHRVPGTAIFMARDTSRAPMALIHNLRHNRVIHETVLFLQVLTEDEPVVPESERVVARPLRNGFHHVQLRYGFMEEPNVPAALIQCRAMGTVFDLSRVTFFLGRELVLPTDRPGMALWREQLFAFITSFATRATAYFQIPAEQVIEIGYQVEI
jgi:KUP system potassium uptake protein